MSVWDHPISKKYIEVCELVKKYYKINCDTPNDLTKKHKESLELYRELLDSLNFKMTSPIYPYDVKDKTTWKYEDMMINGSNFIRNVLNPHWKYNKA